MKKLALSLMACSLLATTARADLAITLPTPAADVSVTDTSSQKIKALCGATYYVGHATTNAVSLTLTTLGELKLTYSLAYSALDGDYGTAVGIILPITASWDIKDLSEATEIDYDIKSAGSAAVSAHMQIGSDIYGDSAKLANAALAQPLWTALTANYKTVKTLTKDLAMNDWFTGTEAATTGWSDSLMTFKIGKAVKNLNFQPKIGWTSSSVIASGAAGTFYIKNVKIIGVQDYPLISGIGCGGTGVTIEDFAATKKVLAKNYLGGYWYAFSDTNSTPGLNDSAVGASAITLPTGTKKWAPSTTLGAIMTATLEKNLAGSSYLYHPYAGWADIGTAMINAGTGDTFVNFQVTESGNTLSAISFDLYAGSTLGATYSIDTTMIRRIIFKTSKGSVDDAQAYAVDIPVRQALNTLSNTVCVDVTAIHQPAWYVKNSQQGTAIPFTAEDLTKLAWEIKIEDQKDPTKNLSLNNTIAVNNVMLYGIAAADGVKAKAGSVNGLKASYGSQLVLSYKVSGATAQIEVVRLDGSKVASIKAASVANGLALPVALARGTYLVSVRGDNSRLVSSVISR